MSHGRRSLLRHAYTVDTQRKTELERELEEAKRKSQQISDERDAVTLSEVPIREQHALLKTQRVRLHSAYPRIRLTAVLQAALDDKRKEAEQRRIEYAKKLSALSETALLSFTAPQC